MGRDDEAVENRAAKPRRSSTDRPSSRSSETGSRRRHHPRGNPDGPDLEAIAEDDVPAHATGAPDWGPHEEQSSVDLTTTGYSYYTYQTTVPETNWTELSLGAQAQHRSSWGEGQLAGDNLEQADSQDYPTGDYYSTSPPASRSSALRPMQDEPVGRSSTDSARQDHAETSTPPPRKSSSRSSKTSEPGRDAGHRRRRDVAGAAAHGPDQSHQDFSGTPAENMEYPFAAGDYPGRTDANVISDLPLASAVYGNPHPEDDYVGPESKRHHGNSSSKVTSQSKYNISGRRKKSGHEVDDDDFLPDRTSDPRRQGRALHIEDDSRDRAPHARPRKTVSSSNNTGSKPIDPQQHLEGPEYHTSEYQGQQSQGTEYHGAKYQGLEYREEGYPEVEYQGGRYQNQGHEEADYQPEGLAKLGHGDSGERLGIEHDLDQLSLSRGHRRAAKDTSAGYTSDAERQAVSMSLERYEVKLLFRTPQDLWEAAQGYYDSANFLGPMVKLTKILTMGYKETHIDFNQMVHFKSLGGSGTTCGVISLTYRKSQTKSGKVPSTASRDVVGTFHVVSQSDWWAYDVWFGPDISHLRNPVAYVGSVSYSQLPVTEEERERMQFLVKEQRRKLEEEERQNRKEKDKKKREKKDKKKG